MNKRTARLRNEPTARLIARLSIPAISSLLINATYNVADSIIVGRFVGTEGLAAVGLNFPVNIFLLAIGILIGTGGAALVGRRLGAEDPEGANRAFGSSLAMVMTIGVSVTLLGLALNGPIVRGLGASGNLFPMAREYFLIAVLGSTFVAANHALNNFAYAEGAGSVGFIGLALSSTLNIVLDYLFVAVFSMGVGGAALATVISQGAAAIFLLGYFFLPASVLRPNICFCRDDIGEVSRVGFSASVRTLSVVLLGLVVNRQALLAAGDLGIAVASVVFRSITIVLLPAIGVNQAFLPVAAYNYGARQYNRMISAAWQSVVYALVICFTASFFVIAYAEGLARVFNPDPEFVRTAAEGFRVAFRLTPLIIFNLVGSGLFQAVGDARRSLLIAASRMGFFFLPLMLILPGYMGLPGIWLSFLLGELASALFAGLITWPKLRELGEAARRREAVPA